MAYYLNLFSPATWEAFVRSPRNVSGFKPRQLPLARRIAAGDKLLCYMTKLSRWCGILEVQDGPFEDDTPIFAAVADPFTVRFRVAPAICLAADRAVPIREDRVWSRLSWTAALPQTDNTWGARFRGSLASIPDGDGVFLESLLREQASDRGRVYAVDAAEYERLSNLVVQRREGSVAVSVPEPEPQVAPQVANVARAEGRESIAIQALLAEIGKRMRMQVWIPRSDRGLVLAEWRPCCCCPPGPSSIELR
jgi:hypothetical protein